MSESLREFENQLQQEALANSGAEVEFGADEYTVGGTLVRRDPDGTLYEFDPDKHAWFPKIDADFIAQYQMNYGEGQQTTATSSEQLSDDYWTSPPTDINSEEYRVWYERYCERFYPPATCDDASASTGSTKAAETGLCSRVVDDSGLGLNLSAAGTVGSRAAEETNDGEQGGKKRKKGKKDGPAVPPKPAEPPAWFEMGEEKNSNVYVSGLPDDVTLDEFKDFMTKVGVIAFDPVFRRPKVKLYTNAGGTHKGDGRCCYIKPESVELALQILDGSDLRGHTVSVEHARFELKGLYDPSKKRRKLTKQEKKKFLEKQDKILGWQPEKPLDTRPRHERIVVIKHAFRPQDFEKDPQQINEVSADFRDECAKYGDVRKVTVYDRHPEGVVMVMFRQPDESDACIAAVHGRWFDGRALDATHWDGRTKYVVLESSSEMEKRLDNWHSFLEGDGKDGKARNPADRKGQSLEDEKMQTLEENGGRKGEMESEKGVEPVSGDAGTNPASQCSPSKGESPGRPGDEKLETLEENGGRKGGTESEKGVEPTPDDDGTNPASDSSPAKH